MVPTLGLRHYGEAGLVFACLHRHVFGGSVLHRSAQTRQRVHFLIAAAAAVTFAKQWSAAGDYERRVAIQNPGDGHSCVEHPLKASKKNPESTSPTPGGQNTFLLTCFYVLLYYVCWIKFS